MMNPGSLQGPFAPTDVAPLTTTLHASISPPRSASSHLLGPAAHTRSHGAVRSNTMWHAVRQQIPSFQQLHQRFFPQYNMMNHPEGTTNGHQDQLQEGHAEALTESDSESSFEPTDNGEPQQSEGANEVPAVNDELADPSYDGEMANMLAEMATGTFRGHDALAQLYDGDRGFNVARLPLFPATAELRQRGLVTPLHSHQLQGLLWMLQAEHRHHMPNRRTALWHTRQLSPSQLEYRNIASGQKRRTPPPLPRGGINADAVSS